MKYNKKKLWIVFGICLIVMISSMSLANGIQTDFGEIDISTWTIDTDDGEVISYKLYVPDGVTPDNPAPAVLLIHGYQNDKDTSATYALELARRGIVAMCMDAYGHGDTTVGLTERGYVNHKLPNWDKTINGPERFLIMMSFSTMDFFTLKDVQGSGMDSSMGGRIAYELLQTMPFVDSSNMGVTGHSMGTWAAWSIAETFQDHKAIVLQCGELFPLEYYDNANVKFNNVLMLQAQYEEFTAFCDYNLSTKGLMETELRYNDFAGQDGPISWDTTYGSIADGSARRIQLLSGINHRLTTINPEGMATTMDWFTESFGMKPAIESTQQTAGWKELLLLIGFLSALASMLPLLVLLTKTKFFSEVAQPLPSNPATLLPKKRWRKTALIAILISAITYPFITQLGHGLMPFPKAIFKMTVGNGVITWFSVLAIIALFMLRHWYKKGEGKRMGVTLYDMGLANEQAPNKLPWRVIGKSALLAVILVATVYIYVVAFTALFKLDFRFVWPLARPFSGARVWQFLAYLPFYLLFFVINGGVKLYGQMRQKELASPAKTQLVWWLRSTLVMLGGLLIITLIEYVPYLMGIGAGMDLIFTSLFGGPFISFLIVIIPQFIILFFLSTYAYRKTGRIYVGSILLAILGAWLITASSSFM
ncbi:MAG: dienelactone hydrolase family protein [Clostridiales bacterium]|nr:dienelactone hydrolase family protein [Clostridiales bacterium]